MAGACPRRAAPAHARWREAAAAAGSPGAASPRVFEDLHWIDGETQALLDALVDSLGGARLLLLVNYRPEYQHDWGNKTSYSQLRLDALPAESAEELLDVLLGDDPALVPLKQLLVKQGNPFFLEESVRTLVETKALAGERGQYRLTQQVQALHIPATVQAVLAARIDRLPPEDKHLLQVASVIGKDVPLALLQTIANLPETALRGRSTACKPPSSFTRWGLFRVSSTPSSTHSPMRSRMADCCRSAAVSFTRVLSRR